MNEPSIILSAIQLIAALATLATAAAAWLRAKTYGQEILNSARITQATADAAARQASDAHRAAQSGLVGVEQIRKALNGDSSKGGHGGPGLN